MFKSRISMNDTSLRRGKAAYFIGEPSGIGERMHVPAIHRDNGFRPCDHMSAAFAYDHMRFINTEFLFPLYIDCRRRLFFRCLKNRHMVAPFHN